MVRQAGGMHTERCPNCGVAQVPDYTTCPFCNQSYQVSPALSATPTLLLVSPTGVREFQIPVDGLRIGYGIWNDVTLSDPTVSRQHALVWIEGDTCFVRDLGSTNGTWLNGQPVWHPTAFREGDRLEIGTTTLAIRMTRHRVQSTRARRGSLATISSHTQTPSPSPRRPHTRAPSGRKSSPNRPQPRMPVERASTPTRAPQPKASPPQASTVRTSTGPPQASPPRQQVVSDEETSPRLPKIEATDESGPGRVRRWMSALSLRRLLADVGILIAFVGIFAPWLQPPNLGARPGVILLQDVNLLPGYVFSLILGLPAFIILALLLVIRPSSEANRTAWAKLSIVIASAAALPALTTVLVAFLIPDILPVAYLQWGIWVTLGGLGLVILGSITLLSSLAKLSRSDDVSFLLQWSYRATLAFLSGFAVLVPMSMILLWRLPDTITVQLANIIRSDLTPWILLSLILAAILLTLINASIILPRNEYQQ